MWRCGGRLANAEIPYAVKYPILLPKSHPLTRLIVTQAHERVFHNGVKETLAETRAKYWILRGRSFTKKSPNHFEYWSALFTTQTSQYLVLA